jgi:uncharacterized membrane protein YeaQ/YmgE (transglycosylase-associated protein family)
MTLLELIVFLIIAGICGVVAEFIVGFSPGGFLASIVVGLVGAFVGSWLAVQLGLPPLLSTEAIVPETAGADIILRDYSFDVVWSIIGAIVLLFIISLARRAGRSRGGRRRYV